MNIFATSSSPKACAWMLDDRRLVKMVLETCQLLSSAVWLNGGEGPYKLTHKGHPCTLWVAECTGNYRWTYNLFMELAREYRRRYDREHKSWHEHSEVLDKSIVLLPCAEMTPFADCSNVDGVQDIHWKYRECLRRKWMADGDRARWTHALPPHWANETENRYDSV